MNLARPASLFGLMLVALTLSCAGCHRPPQTPGSTDSSSVTSTVEDRGLDWFEDVTPRTGIDFTYRNGEDLEPPHLSILESLGGGVALIDYDGDGLLDVFLPGGGYFDGPDKTLIRGHPSRLFRNLGNFRFQDVTVEAGLATLAHDAPWFYTHGAAVADYDLDGWPDLLVTGWGRVALFRNVRGEAGKRRFVDVTSEVGLDQGITWTTSAAWADLDGDGRPDLYLCQYVDWSFANHPTDCNYDGKTRDVCPPKKFSGLKHKVFHNRPDGKFEDVSDSAGLAPGGPHASKGLGVIAVDVNLDGKPDLYVANDTVPNFLYVNRSTLGTIRLEEMGSLSSTAYDGHGGPNGSMGVDAGDPDGSGLPWLWTTNYESELHALYKNRSTPKSVRFVYYSQASGIGALGQKFVGWGTGFIDFDHDGWEDLLIVNGHAIRYPTGTTRRQRPVLMKNHQGKFKIISERGGSYFHSEHLARGIALGDLDNDGTTDVVISHMNEPVTVLRGLPHPGTNWLGIQLADDRHRDLVGTRVILQSNGRSQYRFAKGGGSYASAPDKRFVFGLGNADRIEWLRVVWPDGSEQTWSNLAINRYHELPRSPSPLP